MSILKGLPAHLESSYAELRSRVASQESEQIVQAARAIGQRVARGGKLIVFGNGGSATDANDFAIDCVFPPAGLRPVPAISLSMEPASLTAIANDVGIDAIFLRQLIAHAGKEDVAVGISTSGSSRNVIAALREARKRGMATIGLLGYDGGDSLGADFLGFTGHKVCGPTGIGVLWARRELLDEMPPFLGGGEMIESVWMDHSTFAQPPHKFEAGTMPIAQAVGLGAAIDYVTDVGLDAIRAHELQLIEVAYRFPYLAKKRHSPYGTTSGREGPCFPINAA